MDLRRDHPRRKPSLPLLRSLKVGWLALRELGLRQIGLNALYRAGLAGGIYQWRTPLKKSNPSLPTLDYRPLFSLPEHRQYLELLGDHLQELQVEADQIVAGEPRIFGGVQINLGKYLFPEKNNRHWSKARLPAGEDVRVYWEAGRFGWAFTLGRAYLATGDKRYAEAFWNTWEEFTAANPVNAGLHWQSGQEVALRLMAYLFALQVFAHSPRTTPERKAGLLQAVVDHARRIPPTMTYARSQNNNHLVSEAFGLYLAGVSLSSHPQAKFWRETGWKWLEIALREQIDMDGSYVQHSMNYHRMLLHLALLGQVTARQEGKAYSQAVRERLAAATRWLLAQVDPVSGNAPNLGHNDGSNILPLAVGEFRDHRPVAQAAAAAFLGAPALPAGSWDELAAWLGIELGSHPQRFEGVESPAVRRLGNREEWATLRAVHYRSRPAHADQLQVELWFNGTNYLMDAGTYAYTHPMGNNPLVHSRFHNAVTIDDADPMLRAGKFLWVDWDQARWLEEECVPGKALAADHDGYRKMGIHHSRRLEWLAPGRWEVTDRVTPDGVHRRHVLRLQWLIPDGPAALEGESLTLTGEHEILTIRILPEPIDHIVLLERRLVHDGQGVIGQGEVSPLEGRFSPSYLQLMPAFSYQVFITFEKPVVIKTIITLSTCTRAK